eukprot:6042836-Pyramimonas_sp.AAC.1
MPYVFLPVAPGRSVLGSSPCTTSTTTWSIAGRILLRYHMPCASSGKSPTLGCSSSRTNTGKSGLASSGTGVPCSLGLPTSRRCCAWWT